jgi:hypothetical protein
MRARYVNDAQTFGGQFTIYTGRYNDNISEGGRTDYPGTTIGYDVGGGANYIWYKPMPALELKMGIIPQIVGGKVGPPTHLRGHDIIVLITYGNIHTSGRQGISGAYKVNDMVSVEVGLYDPDDDTLPAIPALGREENIIPRLDFAVPIRFKAGGTSILVNPKGSVAFRDYPDVTTGDSSFTITTIGFDSQVKFGPVTGMLEIHTTQNLEGGDDYTGQLGGWIPLTVTGTTINETTGLQYWAGVNYAINAKNGVDLFYGSATVDRDDGFSVVGRSSYGLRYRYNIAANFLLFPHLQVFAGHDYEQDGVKVGEATPATQLGINFYLVF